ncbi:hypothetical protein JAAARDRAFT_39587 [Jaapia argillacea MUCL 33604]|uniref:Protein kinase domain-containing protein n=1 Tax=Jaapia argillacea MUCL 33604 TaxID=933084 RepID=A0A067PPJ0_9AGAM|nr:hypothetical protein JAAARDRAFT_39587 [Jaapia argillacea MUCL 33604]
MSSQEGSQFSSAVQISEQSLSSISLPSLYRQCASLAVFQLSNVVVTSHDTVRYAHLMRKWIHDLHAAIGDIHILLLSQRFRMFLHEVLTSFKVDKCIIRDALRDDEAQILNRLQLVLQSGSSRKEVLSLENENAEWFLVFLQDVTDNFSIDDELRRSVHRLSINLSQASEKLPTSLLLRGVITSSGRQVGGGGFADIFIGEYSHRAVALKRLRIFEGLQEKVRVKKMFFREALIWHRLRHPRVLPFLGIDAESFAPYICIVAPWIANRDIMAYIRRNGLGSLDAHRVLIEVSEGLQYLHKENVVHGDLRGAGIFLDDSCHVLLADFGLTNFADATKVVTTVHRDGSTRWMAPELLAPKKFGISFQRSFASDVYAFGCVCLEVLTGERPFSDIPSDVDFLMTVATSQLAMQPTRPDLGEPARQMVLDKLWSIILQCLAQSPRDRLSTLSEGGSLLELMVIASVVTATPEVKNPTVTGGTDGSLSIITTPSERPTGRYLQPVQLFHTTDILPLSLLGHRRYHSLPLRTNSSWRPSVITGVETGETLTPGLNRNDQDKGPAEQTRWCRDICGASFSRRNDLLGHMIQSGCDSISSSEEKPFPCHQCDKTFPKKSDLNRHMRNMHRESASTSAIEDQPPSQTSSISIDPPPPYPGSTNDDFLMNWGGGEYDPDIFRP